ncbi:MAG: hypothetical protein ACTHPS_28345 [Streptosporangiaceae bacterium]
MDFEDSGRNDRVRAGVRHRAHRHVARSRHRRGRHTRPFGLTAAESAMVLSFRRVFAVFWLHLVHNRPGPVAGKQAERVLNLLDL